MLNNVGFLTKLLRPIAAGLDSLVYGLIGWILSGILELSTLMASETFAQTIYKNLYIIISVFMVFKLTFSFIQYVVSPDKMLDKEQGVGKVITNIVIALIMLVFLPILFFQPMIDDMPILEATQKGVLNTLPKIILGESGVADDDDKKNDMREQGEQLAVDMLSSLFIYQKDDTAIDPDTGNEKEGPRITSFDEFRDKVNDNSNDKYDYDYMFPVSTIAGIVLVVVLIGVAIDVAIRAFKLIILQIIAPIPVMTYIDPKSSKDGAFNSWIKSFISTFIDLFVKIGSIYVLLLLIQKLKLFSDNGIFGDQISNIQTFKTRTFVRIFLVIGLFKFAKDAPKFIKDAMGIKDNGSGGGSFGKMLSGMAGAAAGFAGGVATGGLSGGMSGLASGFSAGKDGKAGQAFSQVRDEQAKLLGKTPGGLKGRYQNKMMQRSVMKHTGLDADKLKELENQKIADANDLKQAELEYENDRGNLEKRQAYEAAAAKAAKSASAFDKADSLAKDIGMKPGFMQKNKRHGQIYRAGMWVADHGKNAISLSSDERRKLHQEKSDNRYREKYGDAALEARKELEKAMGIKTNTIRGGVGTKLTPEDGKYELDARNQARKDVSQAKKDLKEAKRGSGS